MAALSSRGSTGLVDIVGGRRRFSGGRISEEGIQSYLILRRGEKTVKRKKKSHKKTAAIADVTSR